MGQCDNGIIRGHEDYMRMTECTKVMAPHHERLMMKHEGNTRRMEGIDMRVG